MKTAKIFYLDFIRAIAVLTILLTHYNALFLYLPAPMPEKCILSHEIFNIYIGNWGVSLFFIISGAALTYTYKNNFSVRNFYTRRMKKIYPMLWISYILAASYYYLRFKNYNPQNVPSSQHFKILLSITGFDSYFEGITPVYKFIGEWFLGCILLLYLIFPLLRKIISTKRNLLLACPFIFLLYFIGIFKNPTPLVSDILMPVRIPEFMFGMLFIQYWKKDYFKWFLPCCLCILYLNTLFRPAFSPTLQTTYIGIASFICLAYLGEKVQNIQIIKKTASFISKYSNPVFLIHHFIIFQITAGFNMAVIGKTESVLLFFVIIEVVFICSILLDRLHSAVMNFFVPEQGSAKG